jgi:phosphoserine aminotransferase
MAEIRTAEYGEICDLEGVNPASDVVFTWNGTTSGVRVPNADWVAPDRTGLTICDATSAAFAQDIDWPRSMSGPSAGRRRSAARRAHGMLVLSPRAVERLGARAAPRPLPKIFRLTKGGKLIDGIFQRRDDQHAVDACASRIGCSRSTGPSGSAGSTA